MININNVELDFELFDADTMEVYEAAFNDVAGAMEAINKENGSKALRLSCDAVKECFDRIFGEGMGTKVCGEKQNFFKHMDAFENLVDEAVKQGAELDSRLEKNKKKYAGNRQQRRAVSKS